MKLLTDFYNYSITGNAASGYPLNNLKSLDTNEIWKGQTASETLVIDLGFAKVIGAILLNNANFTSAVVTCANNTSFTGGISKNLTLKKDDLGIYRAFSTITSSSYRYIRVVCSSLVSGSVPTLGNIIIGPVSEIIVSEWSSDIRDKVATFESDGGAYREKKKGQSRHEFSATLNGTKAELDALPLNFDNAVIFTDLDDAADAYIIGTVKSRRKSTRNPIDSSLTLQFSEII